MIGKNYSYNNRGTRRKSDFYETPYSLTQQLLDTNEFVRDKIILEPACGAGAIVKVLKDNNYSNIVSYDIEVDFVKETTYYPQIVTNPPFSLAVDFILKAKQISDKFSFLLPLNYLHGKSRYDTIYLDNKFPLKCVYVFTRYPLLGDSLREDGKYNTGMMVYAWYIWERGITQEPIIRWLDNNDFILRSNNE